MDVNHLPTKFEGVDSDGMYVYTQTPDDTSMVAQYVHLVPALPEGGEIHDPSSECYCDPGVDASPAGAQGLSTVWTVEHRNPDPT